MEPTNISHESSVRMTEYLIAARAAIILWTNLAAMPPEIVFDRIEAEWERRRRRAMKASVWDQSLRAVWNGIAIRTKSRRKLSLIFGQREQSWSTK
jgi:hypothetical protein